MVFKQNKKIFFLNSFLLGLLFLAPALCFPQNKKRGGTPSVNDSILSLIKNDQPDSSKVNHLNALAWDLKSRNPDTAVILSNQALALALSLPSAEGRSGAMNSLGRLGVFYRLKAEYPKALDYFFKALKAAEELGNKYAVAIQLGNIGNVYTQQTEYAKALNYYFRALKMKEELGNKKEIGITSGNIGNVYFEEKNYPKALEYYFKALKAAEELGNKSGIAIKLGNIGIVYKEIGDYEKALEYYFKALKLAEEIGSKNSIAADLGNIGILYHSSKKYAESEKYLLEALALVKGTGELNDERQFEEALSDLYTDTKRFPLAFMHYKKAIALRDAIFNEEKNKEITRKEMYYEFDKRQTADSIKNAEHIKQEQIRHDHEIKQQKIYTYGGAIGFALMLLVAVISFRAYRGKQQANEIISHQKDLVEDKQKEILDSIHYAERIQKSLLPTEKYIEKNLIRLQKR